jgi:hypothetical protein
MQSMYSSPVPKSTCSPDSSTQVLAMGYALLTWLRPSTIFGNSAGFNGSVDSQLKVMTPSPMQPAFAFWSVDCVGDRVATFNCESTGLGSVGEHCFDGGVRAPRGSDSVQLGSKGPLL